MLYLERLRPSEMPDFTGVFSGRVPCR